MGLMGIVNSLAGGNSNGQVAGGLMQELEQRPGGISSVFQSFQNNGMGNVTQQWAQGQTAPASQQQVEQGLGGTGIIDGIANRIGMSPTMVKAGLAVALPVLMHHYVANGHVTPQGQPTGNPMPEPGGVLQSVLGRIL